MEPWLYALLSGPLCLTATFFSVIFFFSLMRPVAGVMLRNPLRILLIVLLFNSTFQQLFTALTIIMLFFDSPFWLEPVTRALIYQFFCGNFSCNAWISIFYYISIVPQQHPIFVWIKRNINTILYVSLVLNQIVLLISLSIGTAVHLLVGSVPNNFTSLEMNKTSPADQDLFKVCKFTYLLYCASSLFTLLFSWGKIFVYLREHLKKMGQCSESFSLPKQKSQMRVTVTGMVQTAIFLPSSLWTIAVAFIYFKMADPNKLITMTFCSMSSLGNLLCFGYSQSVFRHGIVSVFNKLKRHK